MSNHDGTWEVTIPRDEGFVVQLQSLLWCLRYPEPPTYHTKRHGSEMYPAWEAAVSIEARMGSETSYCFHTRYHRDLAEAAIQDAAREAFLRLNAEHRAELTMTEFVHHPYREEGNPVCTVEANPCCYNPMVTRLSRWAETADDCYEEALLEINDQQSRLNDLVDSHQGCGDQISMLQTQLQANGAQYEQLSDRYMARGEALVELEEQLRKSKQQINQLEEQLHTRPVYAAGTSTEPVPSHPAPVPDHYYHMTPASFDTFQAMVEQAFMLSTESAPYLVDPTAATSMGPTPSSIPVPSEPGSGEGNPIQIYTDTESEAEPMEIKWESSDTDSMEEEVPPRRLTHTGGPLTRQTARKSTRPPSRKIRRDSEATTSEPWGLRFASAADHPLPAPGSCGWMDD
uniref:Uncharacterized protein n=1 Tax=Oryza australiensis TaxID=4532 RepID=Q0ZLH5_9ORYZ|nr:hypothetical protein [Oryza australiensis]